MLKRGYYSSGQGKKGDWARNSALANENYATYYNIKCDNYSSSVINSLCRL